MRSAKSIIIFFCVLTVSAYGQEQCSKCKVKPGVATYDLDVQVPQPELNGTDSTGWLDWLQLFWLARHANAFLFQDNKNCIQFLVGPDMDHQLSGNYDVKKIEQASASLPASGYKEDYITTGYIKKNGDNYIMHLELQAKCSGKHIASADIPFQLSSSSDYIRGIAKQAAGKLTPLIGKINEFEMNERKVRNDFALGGNSREWIKLKPSKANLAIGQSTDVTVELKDCDGVPLEGREIIFSTGNVGGMKITGTQGGVVTPLKITTGAGGVAKVNFKKTGKSAIINAYTLTATSENCNDAFIGTVKVDELPSFKITVDFTRKGSEQMNMYNKEDNVTMAMNSVRGWTVTYHVTAVYYPKSTNKGQQFIIIPEELGDAEGEVELEPLTESNDEEAEQKGPSQDLPGGGTVYLQQTELMNDAAPSYIYYWGFSKTHQEEKKTHLVASPLGAPKKPDTEMETIISNSPLPPSLSFSFKNNDLDFFSCAFDFNTDAKGKSPTSGEFSIEQGKKPFPVKRTPINDPNSPYKWEYLLLYKDESGSAGGSVAKIEKKEFETAIVHIYSTF